ncbi:MAG TPA: ATP-binding protein [Macromonas sp.]|nr:ATP-binding protein [Macromonas sp.]
MTLNALPVALGPTSRRWLWALLGLAVLALAGMATYRTTVASGTQQLKRETTQQLDVLATAIDGMVTRHAAIPSAIQVNQEVLALLRAPAAQQTRHQDGANRFLEQLNAHLGGPALFVMDTQGKVVASSDWIYSSRLLGEDLSYMPFFRSAMAGIPARHYAVDHVRPEPGYFFAQPIRDEGQGWRVIGVAVVKSSIRELERRWMGLDFPAVIVDNNRVVLLAAPPEWRYTSLEPLSGEAMVDFDFRPYADRKVGLRTLGLNTAGAEEGVVVQLPKHLRNPAHPFRDKSSFLVISRNLPETAWRVIVFSDLHDVHLQAFNLAMLTVAALGCLWLGVMFLGQRRRLAHSREQARKLMARSNQELERKVTERTAKLSEVVTRLRREVQERRRAEQTLREAQDELVQAAKLAVVGQMAAGITHELAQPLSAVRTLSENAIAFMDAQQPETARQNLGLVGQLTEQMGQIIQPLKSFCRKSPSVTARLDVSQALDAALLLFHQRLRQMAVTVERHFEAGTWHAYADANRLQQVLVNLIGNALDAMANSAERRLSFAVRQHDGTRLELTVTDTGPGLPEQVQARLFEPFFTTKPSGEGLGLGLAISRDILRDFGGDLTAEPAPGAGACFVIILPTAPDSLHEP